ncbi:MAG: flavin reductase family protein [Rhodoferax sp.]|nr:flavin reductase family protein [Rhodoferax sp.]MCB2007158.1 flavin reductase family protein [Rhodoferax sp.]MCB2028600.1 flavin reductase family protein [Rhodoferax sp.]MCP5262392.1 flavin reductase family protein [Rhodoferax sp.]
MSERFTTITADGMDTATAYRLLCGVVVPRPVAWITTMGADGVVNAAPFSSYNYVAHSPPMLAVNIGSRNGTLKDTARNIVHSGEFVVNVATESNMELMHQTSAEFASDTSEAQALDIALLPSTLVRPPRIAISPVQMECKLHQAVQLGRLNTLYIGEVVAFHLSDAVYDGRHVDSTRLRPIARLGGPHYAALGEIFTRPILQTPPASVANAGSEP